MKNRKKLIGIITTVALSLGMVTSAFALMQCESYVGRFTYDYDYGTILPNDDARARTDVEVYGHGLAKGGTMYCANGYVGVELYYKNSNGQVILGTSGATQIVPGQRNRTTGWVTLTSIDNAYKTRHFGRMECDYYVSNNEGSYDPIDQGACFGQQEYSEEVYH